MSSDLGAKQLEILHELLPAAARFAVLVNPKSPLAEPTIKDVQLAASALSKPIEVLAASTKIDVAFTVLAEKRADALLIGAETMFITRRVQLATLATRHTIPAISFERGFTEVGGLMSFGSSFTDAKSASILVGFSRAKCRPIYQSCGQKRPRRSASTCLLRCSPAPTR